LDIIRTQEASELAQQHNKMDIYTEIVKDVATKDECLKLARYFFLEKRSDKSNNIKQVGFTLLINSKA
jgi:hypothetical protein